MQPADWHARQSALDPTRSFICEAPAGSGKTELLTQRVLTLLAGAAVPEAVLAITFTRKAAAEMRERVLHALLAATGAAPTDPHRLQTWQLARAALARDAEAGWQLLANPGRLQIRTFDGLARQLMQSLPLYAGLDATWPPADDPLPLYQEAAQDLLATLEQQVSWSDDLAVLFAHLDNRYQDFHDLLVAMLASRDSWMSVLGIGPGGDIRPLLERYLRQTLADKVAALTELFGDTLRAPLLQLADFAGANMRRSDPDSPVGALAGLDLGRWPDTSDTGLAQWRALASLLLTKNGTWRKTVTKRDGFGPGESGEKSAFQARKQQMHELLAQLQEADALRAALAEIPLWPTPSFADAQWPVLEALTRVLPIAVVHLHWVFQRRQSLDFTEISQRARLALGDEDKPTDLLQRLDYTIAHILVDEFQDTSFTQVDLLKKLTFGWQPGDGRTLFCVGDAMQSIYSFRGANVGLFLFCQQHGLAGIALERLRLSTNFRSQGALVDWVNRTFQKAFPQALDISSGAVPFNLADAFREAAAPAVQTQVFADDQPAAAAEWLAAEVVKLRSEQPTWRLAILVKAKQHAARVTQALTECGVRYRALDMVPLAQRSVIQDALALACALLEPGDRIAWLAVLRAPWCGLTLADLSVLCAAADGPVIDQMEACLARAAEPPVTADLFAPNEAVLSADGRQRLARVTAVLKQALVERQRKPLPLWLEGTWRALGAAALSTAAEDAANIERLWSMIEALAASGEPLDRERLLRRVAELYAAPDPLADEHVQVMTMHKAKGLEFDAVFLPDLHRASRGVDRELLLWQERLSRSGDDTLLLAPISARGGERDPIYKHLAHEKSKRLNLEACRLLYVACTRARERLYLLANLKSDPTGALRWQAPRDRSLLGYIWPSVAHRAAGCDGEPNPGATDKGDSSPPLLIRVAHGWQPPTPPSLHSLAPYVPPYQFVNEALPECGWLEDRLPRLVGTLVHEMAWRLARTPGLPGDFSAWARSWQARLVAEGLSPAHVQAGVAEIGTCVERLLQHPRFLWLQGARERYLEYPLRSVQRGEVHTLVLDALVIDNAAAWVVDYKTSEPAPDEGVDAFLAREAQAYRPAMQGYRKAVAALGYAEVRTVLFFIKTGHWHELA